MNATIDNSVPSVGAAESGLWLSPPVVAALVALAGVVVGLIARDIFMAAYLARRKRTDELADNREAAGKAQRDLVRLYADPLKDAVTSLKFRLHEIVEKKQARYLLAGSPKIPFLEYKRISTLYRIAAVLGWIRAIRRERSYLDPAQAAASVEMQAISELEAALADGTHVELQRLEELSALWAVPPIDPQRKLHIANLIDGERADFLAKHQALSFRNLGYSEQAELAARCANIIRREAEIEIAPARIAAAAEQAAVTFGIKEAYIYRDWQTAIGDLMLQEDKGGARHFSVIGFGVFEDIMIEAQSKERPPAMRWFDRLGRLIHDLNMTREDTFDARREQLRRLYQCCEKLEAALVERIATPAEMV